VPTDPRDALLQRQVPTIAVPRFGPLDPLERNGHRFLAGGTGLWLELRRPWLYLRQKVAWCEVAMPYGDPGEAVEYAFSAQAVLAMQANFRHDAEYSMPNEAAAWGVWNERTGRLEYRLLAPLEASPAGIRFERPRLADHEHLALDLHSHGALPAGFSATDDDDDAGEVKVATVYGGIGTDAPSWATRLCALGLFIEEDEA